MGSVWRAEDTILRRTVAVKLIQLATQSDEKARARFTREAQAAARLQHPNIVTVFDFGIDHGVAYMVMEYLAGPDLAGLVRDRGSLPIATALDYLKQTASGLAAAHAEGVLHRDIKPANLMLTRLGDVKVLDFGIAAVAERTEQLTTTNQIIGTLAYLAPERSMGSQASVQSDLYGLGCVATVLLTGRPPFEGTTGQLLLKHLNEVPRPISERTPGVPVGLDDLVSSMLAKDPAERPRSAQVVADRLRALRQPDSSRTEAPVPSPAAPASLSTGKDNPARVSIAPAAAKRHPVRAELQGETARTVPAGGVSAPEPPEATPTKLKWAEPAEVPLAVAPVSAGTRWRPGKQLLVVSSIAAAIVIVAWFVARSFPGPQTPPPNLAFVPVGGKPFALAIDAGRGRAYVTHAGTELKLTAVDTGRQRVVQTLRALQSAEAVGLDPKSGNLYLTDSTRGSVAAVSMPNNRVAATFTIGGHPIDLAVDVTANRVLAISQATNTVSVIDILKNEVITTLDVGKMPTDVAVDSSLKRAYVANRDSDQITVIDTKQLSPIGNIPVKGPQKVAVDATSHRVLVLGCDSTSATCSAGSLSIFDVMTSSLEPVTKVGVAIR